MLEELGQRGLAERDVRLVVAARCRRRRCFHGPTTEPVQVSATADAIPQHGQASIDLARLPHPLGRVPRYVARGLGSREIDHEEETVLGLREARIRDPDPADRVRPRRGVVLLRGGGLAEHGRAVNVRHERVPVHGVVSRSPGQVGRAVRVLEDGDRLPGAQQVGGGVSR